MPQDVPQHVLESIGADGPIEYPNVERSGHGRAPSSASEAANGARSAEELLRRLSLTGIDTSPQLDLIDPHSAHPSLGLSGNVISATFAVPYKVGYTTTGEWVRSLVPPLLYD